MTEREELEQIQAQERERALAGLPPEPDSVRRRGVLHANLFEFDKALAAFDEAERLVAELGRPADPRININRGGVYLEQDRPTEALKVIAEAEQQYIAQGLTPHPAVAANRGAAYRTLGRLEESLEQYELALKGGEEMGIPTHYIIPMNQGTALFFLGRLDESMAAFDRADKLRVDAGLPEDPKIILGRGMVHETRRDYEKALEYYDDAQRVADERGMQPDPNIVVNRGNALTKLGRRAEAMAAYTEALWRYGRLGSPVPPFVMQQVSCAMKPGQDGCSMTSGDFPAGAQISPLDRSQMVVPQMPQEAAQAEKSAEQVAAAVPETSGTDSTGIPSPMRFPRKVDCDAFLSHRRRDGGAYARLIKLNFELRGRHAFLDVDEKRPTRRFDEELLRAIERAGSFVLILTPGALDRCVNEGDWLRREIRHAISLDMNIVPVMMPEFKWPKADELPEDIRPITLCEGLSYSHDYFPAFMDTLIQWAVREGEMAAA